MASHSKIQLLEWLVGEKHFLQFRHQWSVIAVSCSLKFIIYDREHLTNLFVLIHYTHNVPNPTRFGSLVIPMFLFVLHFHCQVQVPQHESQ
jgi:hypothetical protein